MELGLLALAAITGLVYDDANGDGHPSAGERGVAGAVVAFGASQFAVTDAQGRFELKVSDEDGIVWVRVPDGFRPGPVWAAWHGRGEVELGLRRLATPVHGPLTFVVAADSHIPWTQENFGAADLAVIAREAIALDPAPAFFTILGDVTQGSKEAEYQLVDRALVGLGVPYVPVPGNHDWYDDGAAWFHHYGPDNYSFDLGDVHFVVWNMAMSEDELRAYLGAELARVHDMTIVALTHAPPSPGAIAILRQLGVSYVLTGHAHSNRVVDHDGIIELNTEPLLMGGLDATPAGYRVVTIEGGHLVSYHRTTVDEPQLAIVSPARGACAPARGGELLVAAELEAGANVVTARVDCATPIAMRAAGGWTYRAPLPALAPGTHEVTVDVATATGASTTASLSFAVCDPGAPPPPGEDWPQLGGGPAHLGARTHELAPPVAVRWTAAAGGHVITAPPAIARGMVFVATTDLGDGGAGGVVAIDLQTGVVRWRAPTGTLRGGVAVVADTGAARRAEPIVVAAQIDGTVLGLDAATGAERWRYQLAPHVDPNARALFGTPATDGGDVVIGHQRAVAALAGASGTPLWQVDPVPEATDSQSLTAIAIGGGVAVGTFNRKLGGMIAWDRATGHELWRREDDSIVAVNASPVIANDTVYVVTGADDVLALDLATGETRWQTRLDPAGFAWGNATVGTPALARGVLVVPTLYRELVALDALSGAVLWRRAGAPSALRATHYRGAGEAGFAASPAITGDIIWTADTSGELTALDLRTGAELSRISLAVPVLSGLATSGDWLVVASYDGTVRALAPQTAPPILGAPASCDAPPPAPPAGCCNAGGSTVAATLLPLALVAARWRRRRRRRA